MAQKPAADFRAAAIVTVTGGEGLHRVEVPFEVHRVARRDLGGPARLQREGRGAAVRVRRNRRRGARRAREVAALPLFPVLAAPARRASEGDVSLDVRATKPTAR